MSDTAEPVVRVSYQSSLGAQRGAVFETYLPLSAPKKSFDVVLDKLRLVCDRQEAIAKVVELTDRVTAEKGAVELLVKDMNRVASQQVDKWNASGRKGELKLSASEVQHRDNMEASIKNRQATIKLMETELVRYQSIVDSE